MEQMIVKVSGVSKAFPLTGGGICQALDNVNLTVARGQMTALIGPDGAGKTTLLRILCGLLAADTGELLALGFDPQREPQSVQDGISYMPQRFGLYEDLTVGENMNLYADLHGVPQNQRPRRFGHLLEMAGLTPFVDRLAGKLSGGMKQKLGLICTLVRSPELLILDEPTVGVDPLSRQELWEILRQLVQEESLSVLVTTAYMDEASRCRQVYVINQGRILAKGSPEKLRQLAQNLCYRVTQPGKISLRQLQNLLLRDDSIVDAVPDRGQVRFIVNPGNAAVEQVAALRHHNLAAEPVEPRLEDSFMLLLHQDRQKSGSESAARVELPPMTEPEPSSSAEGAIDIEVKNLLKQFGDFTAVSHTSFQVHQGEVFGLLGPNGAGKTTTFRMLCGLLPATSGELSVAGVDVRKSPTKARARLGYVAQKFSLYGNLTVRENLRFFGEAYGLMGRELEERLAAVTEQFSLGPVLNQEADTLPMGYRQRLSMAAALLHEPKILFLDEPTSGIDPLARRRFWQQITELAAAGTTVIITTHFMEEAEYCDRFMIQDQGQLLVLGSPAEIRQRLNLPEADMNEIFMTVVAQGRDGKGDKDQ